SGFKLVERKPRTVEAVNLTAARRVVSVGRGIQNKEDLALIDSLAAVLEAEVGCTRPIAEGQDWMSRERYIGVSGVMLKPDLFVTVGVSGQVQHMVGAAGAKTIIAINKDKNAPVFKQVDYGIVGDLYEVVPKIVETMKA
ncbi:MAG: FAD-binding protein, partial [Raoultibacter sp.]